MTRGFGEQWPANITHHLRGINFPANRDDLIDHAMKNGAEDDILDRIEEMPERKYESMADVMAGYGDTADGAMGSDQYEVSRNPPMRSRAH